MYPLKDLKPAIIGFFLVLSRVSNAAIINNKAELDSESYFSDSAVMLDERIATHKAQGVMIPVDIDIHREDEAYFLLPFGVVVVIVKKKPMLRLVGDKK